MRTGTSSMVNSWRPTTAPQPITAPVAPSTAAPPARSMIWRRPIASSPGAIAVTPRDASRTSTSARTDTVETLEPDAARTRRGEPFLARTNRFERVVDEDEAAAFERGRFAGRPATREKIEDHIVRRGVNAHDATQYSERLLRR